MKHIYVVLYDEFTALDVFGPVEALGNIPEYQIHFISKNGGIINNSQGIRIMTEPFSSVESQEILLVPGGFGSRAVINDDVFISDLKHLICEAEYLLCVCTGSALAAKTEMLDGKNATTNKTAFAWVQSIGKKVNWNRQARWVKDGNIYTSAGVSAGTDMALGFICDQFGIAVAEDICNRMEYHWNRDSEHDDF